MKTFSFVLAALLLAPAAHADKFYLGSEAEAKKVAEGSNPTTIEGVLLAETATHYHLRVVGGEVVLEKKNVWKVEKDGLTVADLLKTEKELAAKSAEEAKSRAVADVVVGRGHGEVVEAAATRSVPVPVAEVGDEGGFDPVIGRVAGRSPVIEEVEAAWQLTKDRRYLKLLRKLRRMN